MKYSRENEVPESRNTGRSSPKVPRSMFLRDVFLCSLGAYGGPEAHMGVFLDQMVVRRKYLDERELVELTALCSILPGPTSTQTIVSIGYKIGGPVLAFFTMAVWALPAILVMAALSFLYRFLEAFRISKDVLRFIGPSAAGFVIAAAFRIGRKVVVDRTTAFLAVLGFSAAWFVREPWVFPAVLAAGGASMLLFRYETGMWNRQEISPPWRYLVLFAALGVGAPLLAKGTGFLLPELFEDFYRYGYLVFGGGQVVVPMMFSELVEINGFMTGQEFLTGYGLVQGVPGPMFSFASYAGGLAARGGSPIVQFLGAAAGGAGIFLPGLLLIFFVYPVWDAVRNIRAIRIFLPGVNAVAGGMITAAAPIMLQAAGITAVNLGVAGLTALCLVSGKVPAPIIVGVSAAAGIFL